MAVADRLLEKAKEYEQRAAHHAERAEFNGKASDEITATGYTLVAIALREVVQALLEQEAEDLAA